MADFLLERELPNLKVAVDSNTLEADNDDCMDLDESSKVEKGADITEPPQPVVVPARVADRARKSSDEMAADDGDDPEAYMVQFAEVYRSLGVDPRRPGGTRLNAVHVRGVTDMGTEDVLEYFKGYDPSSIDWINDYACNVVWQRNQDAARALQELSRPLLVKPKVRGEGSNSPTGEAKPPPSCVSPLNRPEQATTSGSVVRQELAVGGDGNEEVVVMSDDEFGDDAGVSGTTAPKGPVPEREELDISEVGVPVPPGEWRRAVVPHPKATILLLRFSNKYDKKMPGAEKHSEYYKKYGNPNYGGMTGLISNSRKRRMREAKSASFALGSARSMDTGDDSDRDRSLLGARQRAVKRMRMRMYADEEEEKQRRGKRPGALGTPTPPTPWSTPGNSPTSDEETFTRSLSTSVSGSSVWDRLSGGRANLFSKRREHEDDDEYGDDDRDRFPLPRQSRYVDLDDPSLRDDYDPAEDGYGDSTYGHDFVFDERSGHGSRRSSRGRRDDDDDEAGDEDARRLLSTVRMAGTDLRSKLEKLRQSRTAPERMNPLRISVSNEAP
ncbi:uncharacterized protein LOC144121116 isoform X1 [Amblyomma americanum]